ncbi:MAG TPA: D-hexose-6-phosphate mutarotase [Gemmatimonadaceae bacterium]
MPLPSVLIEGGDGARAAVSLHGAQVISWVDSGHDEHLFLSSRSELKPRSAIRGGIPVIFPQFSTFGSLPKHGFARTSDWSLVGPGTFRLTDSTATRALWPYPFVVEVTVTVAGQTLDVHLRVRNPGREAFEFTAALHTYLRVSDVRRVVVRGLEGAQYRDSTAGGTERTQPEHPLSIVGEVDRIYPDVSRPVHVEESDRVRRCSMTGFRDVVIWNPGPTASLPDMEPGGYERMLCVEAAAIVVPIRLEPGEEWLGTQRLEARDALGRGPHCA